MTAVPAVTDDSDGPAAMVERLRRATNAHDLEALVACFAADYRNETPGASRAGLHRPRPGPHATGSTSSRSSPM